MPPAPLARALHPAATVLPLIRPFALLARAQDHPVFPVDQRDAAPHDVPRDRRRSGRVPSVLVLEGAAAPVLPAVAALPRHARIRSLRTSSASYPADPVVFQRPTSRRKPQRKSRRRRYPRHPSTRPPSCTTSSWLLTGHGPWRSSRRCSLSSTGARAGHWHVGRPRHLAGAHPMRLARESRWHKYIYTTMDDNGDGLVDIWVRRRPVTCVSQRPRFPRQWIDAVLPALQHPWSSVMPSSAVWAAPLSAVTTAGCTVPQPPAWYSNVRRASSQRVHGRLFLAASSQPGPPVRSVCVCVRLGCGDVHVRACVRACVCL